MKDDEMKRQMDLVIAAMGPDPDAAEELTEEAAEEAEKAAEAAWGNMSTDARSLICAFVIRALGHEVTQKAVSTAGGFDRAAFAENAGREDQRTANGRRRLIIDNGGIDRVVSGIAERAGLDRPEDSDALKIRQLEESIAKANDNVKKHERLNAACPRYFQMMRRQQLKHAKKTRTSVAPVHGDEVVDINDRLNDRRESND